MSDRRTGSNESRAAEAALPGSTGGSGGSSPDQEAKVRNLRTMKSAGSTPTGGNHSAFSKGAPDGSVKADGSTKPIKPAAGASKAALRWQKAGNAVSVHTQLSKDLLQLRGLVGTNEGNHDMHVDVQEKIKAEMDAKNKWYVLMPDSNFKMVWDLSQVVVLLYVASIVPLRIGFNTDADAYSTMWWIEVVVDFYFLTDIILNFVTAYEDKIAREIVIDLKKIRKQYFRGFFLIDFMSILPVNYVEQAMNAGAGQDTGGGGDLKTLKILRLIRLTRLLRLARVKRLLKTYTEMLENLAGVFSLMSIIIVAIFLSHFVSCMWYWVGDSEAKDGWVAKTFECDPIADPIDCIHGDAGMGDRYLATYWWAITLLLTAELTNHIHPHSNGEIVFVIVLQLMGAIVFGFIIGTVGTILMSWGLLEERITRKLAELREFMNEKQVPKATRKKVKKFMEEYYRSKAGYDEAEVINNLPPSIAVELLDSIYRGTLLRVPIFKNLEEDVICRICLLMKPMKVSKGEFVFQEKEPGREMYIIREGKVQIMRYGLTIGVLHKDCFFGEDCMVAVAPGKRNLRQRTAVAIEDCELAFLRAADADKIAADHPAMLQSFQDLASKKEMVENGRLNMMINQVAAELGVDPSGAAMDGVLSAVQMIASEEDMLTPEVRAARKIANWWRWQKKRKEGLVDQREKFPISLDETSKDNAVQQKIRNVMMTSNLWKGQGKAIAGAARGRRSSIVDFKPTPPGTKYTAVVAKGPRSASPLGGGTSPTASFELEEKMDALQKTQKLLIQKAEDSDIQRMGLEQKLDNVIAALAKIDEKLST